MSQRKTCVGFQLTAALHSLPFIHPLEEEGMGSGERCRRRRRRENDGGRPGIGDDVNAVGAGCVPIRWSGKSEPQAVLIRAPRALTHHGCSCKVARKLNWGLKRTDFSLFSQSDYRCSVTLLCVSLFTSDQIQSVGNASEVSFNILWASRDSFMVILIFTVKYVRKRTRVRWQVSRKSLRLVA